MLCLVTIPVLLDGSAPWLHEHFFFLRDEYLSGLDTEGPSLCPQSCLCYILGFPQGDQPNTNHDDGCHCLADTGSHVLCWPEVTFLLTALLQDIT